MAEVKSHDMLYVCDVLGTLIPIFARFLLVLHLPVHLLISATADFNLLAAVETAVADSVQLAKSAPVLVQLSERQWGASATLPLDTVPGECCSVLARQACHLD